VRDLPLLKTPERTILVSQRSGIRRNVGFNQTSKWSGAALEVVQHIGSRKRHHNVSLAAVVAQAWLLPNPSIPPPPRSHEYFRRLACWLDFREFSIWPHWSS
jgi:hypothetical protein